MELRCIYFHDLHLFLNKIFVIRRSTFSRTDLDYSGSQSNLLITVGPILSAGGSQTKQLSKLGGPCRMQTYRLQKDIQIIQTYNVLNIFRLFTRVRVFYKCIAIIILKYVCFTKSVLNIHVIHEYMIDRRIPHRISTESDFVTQPANRHNKMVGSDPI